MTWLMPSERRATQVVELAGELDAFTARSMRTQLHEAIEHDTAGVLVVDLSLVTFLDSSALGVLVGALRRLRERGGELRLVLPPPPARRIFELTGLDAVFPDYPSRPEAVAG